MNDFIKVKNATLQETLIVDKKKISHIIIHDNGVFTIVMVGGVEIPDIPESYLNLFKTNSGPF